MEVNKQSIWISATTETTANCQKTKQNYQIDDGQQKVCESVSDTLI